MFVLCCWGTQVFGSVNSISSGNSSLDSLEQVLQELKKGDPNSAESFQILMQIAKEYQSLNDTSKVIQTYVHMADLSRGAGNLYQGLTILSELENLGYTFSFSDLAVINCVKGSIHYELNNKDSAIYFARLGLRFDNELNENKFSSLLYNLLGSSYKGANNDSSIKYIKLSAQLAINQGEKSEASLPLINLAKTYNEIKQPVKAELTLFKALDLLDDYDVPIYRQMAYHELSQTYITLNDFKNAVKYLSLRDSVNYELKNNETQFKIQKLVERAESLEESKQLNELENQVAIAKLKDRSDAVKLKLGAVIILILVIVVILVFVLYSEVRKKNKYRLKKNNELRDLNHFKDKVLSIISHDLRSPMAQVITYQQAKMYGVKFSKEEEAKMNKIILAVSENGLLVLDNLLKWAQGQLNGQKLHIEQRNLVGLITTLIHQVKSLSLEKQVEIKFDSPPVNWPVDADLVHIVLRNLISNALKFSKEGQVINVSIRINKQELEIIVQDQGPGIPEHIKTEIQLGKAVKASHGTSGEKGAGLGLVLTTDFVKQMGGRLTFISPPIGGTIAMVELPNA